MIHKCDVLMWSMLTVVLFSMTSCTVKAVGDPNRPITINAHITVDVKGMQNTATNIEDYVSGKSEQPFKQ
ncbi:MAG: hypothetical protein JW938_06865 [Candidatus Omnitrophica bacterium]|nr:hypothetical protein [Candidatus Omnitrophota bacterium]